MTYRSALFLGSKLLLGFPLLQKIDFCGNMIGDSGLAALYHLLSKVFLDCCPMLQTLDFSNNHVTNKGANVIKKWILCSKGALSVCFDHNPIDGIGVGLVLQSKYWESFRIEGNQVSANAESLLNSVSRSCLFLKYLSVKDNNLSQSAAIIISSFVKKLPLPSLQQLSISESMSSSCMPLLIHLGYETSVMSLKSLMLLNCHFSCSSVISLYKELYNGCYPMLSEFLIQETSHYTFGMTFHYHHKQKQGSSIVIELVDNGDYSDFLGELHFDPYIRSVKYLGNSNTSFGDLFSLNKETFPMMLYEYFEFSYVTIPLYVLQSIIVTFSDSIRFLALNYLTVTELQSPLLITSDSDHDLWNKTTSDCVINDLSDSFSPQNQWKSLFTSSEGESRLLLEQKSITSSNYSEMKRFVWNWYRRKSLITKKLATFSFRQSNLTDEVLFIVFTVLSVADVHELDLRGNAISSRGVDLLYYFVVENNITSIERILMDFDNLNDISKQLLDRITHRGQLKKQDFADSSISRVLINSVESPIQERMCCCSFL